MHMAMAYDYYEVVYALIDRGADVTVTNDAGFPASRGLEGDKSLALLAMVAAKDEAAVIAAMKLCAEKGRYYLPCFLSEIRIVLWTILCFSPFRPYSLPVLLPSFSPSCLSPCYLPIGHYTLNTFCISHSHTQSITHSQSLTPLTHSSLSVST